MENLIGTTLEHYHVLARIRETPTRILYRAYDARAYHTVALEVIKVPVKDPVALLEAIREQAQKNATLKYENIASMLDSGISNTTIFMVFDFVPTHTLRRLFDRTYSWHDVSIEFVSIAYALACAHDGGIFYGWLNPSSILLDEKRSPILFDFGMEQIISEHVLAHTPGVWVNRWGYQYRAPEQLRGAAADSRADIYSLGMMLLEWMKGSTGFNEPRVLAALHAKLTPVSGNGKPAKPLDPPAIQKLIDKCTAVDPNRRYQSMKELFILLAHGTYNVTLTKRVLRRPMANQAQRFANAGSFWAITLFIVVLFIGGLFAGWPTLARTFLSRPVPTFAPALKTAESITPGSTPSAAPTEPTVGITEIPTEIPSFTFGPVFQGTPIDDLTADDISDGNIHRLSTISRWGMGNLNQVAASADGKWIATASSAGVFVFNASDLNLERYIDTLSSMSSVAFSPDGRYLAAGYEGGLIQLWSTDTWKAFDVPYYGHTRAILDLAFSPDNTKLLSVGEDEQIIQWTINVHETPASSFAKVSQVTCAAYSADGSRIATGGNDFRIRILDAASLQELGSKDFKVQVVDLAVMPGQQQFAVGGSDGKVKIVTVGNDITLADLDEIAYPLTSVAVSPQGDRIAAADLQGGITVWNAEGAMIWQQQNLLHQSSETLNSPGSAHSISFSMDGKVIFSAPRIGTLKSINAASGATIRQNQNLNGRATMLKISHNGKYAVTQHDAGQITVWDISRGSPLYQLDGTIASGEPFSVDDQYLAIASSPTAVTVHVLANGSVIYTLNSSTQIQAIQFIPEHNQLAFGHDRDMHIWSMSSGQEIISQRTFTGRGCATISDRSDRTVFYMTNYQHILTDTKNREKLCEFSKLNWVVDINEARGLLAYGGSSKLTIVDTQGSTPDRELSGVNGRKVITLAISPDGNWLAASLQNTGFHEFSIHIWSTTSGEEILNLPGHNGTITSIRFSPDGRFLLSTSEDGTIRIWGIPR